jgi:uncharacterized phiE125 gp8 family phage protein
MKYSIKTDTSTLPISVAELKHYLRIVEDDAEQDTLLRGLIIAARDSMEQELHMSLVNRVYTYYFDCFDSELDITLRPAVSVDAIRYYDADDVQQTLATSIYQSDLQKYRAEISLKDGQSWPTVYNKKNAVEVDVTIGHGSLAEDVPEDLKLALKMLAAHWFDNRALEGNIKVIPQGIERIIALNRNLEI